MNVFQLIHVCLREENSVSFEDQTAGRSCRTAHCSSLLTHSPVKMEVLGVQTIFGGIMGIRQAHVKLLPLHPVATATMANIVTHFPFLLHTTQLPENIIWLVQYNWVW